VLRGLPVRHLLERGRSEPHRLYPRAVRTDGRITYPAAGQLTL
jgi:hypothetical protein